jgi:hypothetical protein
MLLFVNILAFFIQSDTRSHDGIEAFSIENIERD